MNSKIFGLLLLFSLFFFDFELLKIYCKKHFPILLFFAWVVIGLLYTEDTSAGLKKVGKLAILPASVLVFGLIKLEPKTVLKILKFYVLCVLIAALYSHGIKLYDFFANNEPSFRNFFNLNYSYLALAKTLDLHPTYYSFFVLIAISIILDFLRQKMKIIYFFCGIILISYLSFFIVHLSSRMAIIILYLLLITHLLWQAYTHKKIIRGIFFLVLLHGFLVLTLLNVGATKYRFQHLLGFTYYTGYTVNDGNHKKKLWSAAFNANKQIVFGNGIGDVQPSLNDQYKLAVLTKPLAENYNSHNQYIEYYVGLGGIGVILFLGLLLYYGLTFVRQKNRLGVYFIGIMSLLCITECIWNRHHGLVFLSIMLGLLWTISPSFPTLDRES